MGWVQAVAVAMPAEAVQELAGAIQDANGGPIQLMSNNQHDNGRAGSQGVALQPALATPELPQGVHSEGNNFEQTADTGGLCNPDQWEAMKSQR